MACLRSGHPVRCSQVLAFLHLESFMCENTREELRIIKVVNAICVFFGISGVIMAIVVSSRSMLLDGLYSFVQSIFILLSSFIVRLIGRTESKRYQFGYAAFEPFFILLRSTVLLAMTLIMALGASGALFSGGYLVRSDAAMGYTLFSVIVCAIVWKELRVNGRKQASPILLSEAQSWKCDTLLSVAVLVGFTFSFLFERAGYIHLAALIDPAMTLIFILFLAPGLLGQLVKSLRELLGGAADESDEEKIEELVEHYRGALPIKEYSVYSTKRGRTLHFSIYIRLKAEVPLLKLDALRYEMMKEIQKTFDWVDSDIIFTIDPSWFALATVQLSKAD